MRSRNLVDFLPNVHLQWIIYNPSQIKLGAKGNCVYALSMSAEEQGFFVRSVFDPSCPEEDMWEIWRDRIEQLRISRYHGIFWRGVSRKKIIETINQMPHYIPQTSDSEEIIKYNLNVVHSALNVFLDERFFSLNKFQPEIRPLFEGRIPD